MTDSEIHAIFFDLGMVLVKFDWSTAIPRIASLNGGDAERIQAFISAPYHTAFEQNEISEDEFMRLGRETTGYTGEPHEFKASWNEIFTEIPSSVQLIRELAHDYPLYALSNTNPWHVEQLERQFDWMQLFTKRFYSHELGVRKPDPRIYQRTLQAAGFAARHVLLIDDRLENIEGAAKVGMRTLHATDPETLPADVRAILARSGKRKRAAVLDSTDE